MPALPTMSLRADPRHHALIRDVARALREHPEMEGALRAVLHSPAPHGATCRDAMPDDALPNLLQRIATLEAGHSALVERVAVLEDGRGAKAASGVDAIRCIATRNTDQLDIEDVTGPPAFSPAPAAPPPAPPAPPVEAPALPAFAAALSAEMAAAGMTPGKLAARLTGMGQPVSREGVRLWLKGHGVKPDKRATLVELFPNLGGVE